MVPPDLSSFGKKFAYMVRLVTPPPCLGPEVIYIQSGSNPYGSRTEGAEINSIQNDISHNDLRGSCDRVMMPVTSPMYYTDSIPRP